jgi:WD40 repeat protein
LWHDSVNSSWTFDSRDSYLSLNRYDSKFKITNDTSINQWKNTQIIKSSEPNTLFLQDNQIWETSSSGYNIAPLETFEFMDDLIIPDNQLVQFSTNAIIDGQGHNLVLGKYAQLLVDSGITITFKNMTIKNTLNTISCPPIRCTDWYSKACFDNTTLSFNDDFALRNGQIFVQNDVNITGTSKFSYRSVLPSYIAPHSNLIFNPNTTFEFYPSTTDNTLIKMADKTSSIIFDNSTLQTTHTGIRLTKGSLYLDNKVTLSSANNTMLNSLGIPIPPIPAYDPLDWIYSVAWSPDGKYLAVGGLTDPEGSNTQLEIFNYNGTSLTITASIWYGFEVDSVAWSPDGKYLAIGGTDPTVPNTDELQIYQFTGPSLNFITSQNYGSRIRSVAWSPDGKYLAIGGYWFDNYKLQIYQFTGSSLSFITSQDYGGPSGDAIWTLAWNPDGKYLALGGFPDKDLGQTELEIFSFNGSSLTITTSLHYGDELDAIAWSPDGRSLAIGGYRSAIDPNNQTLQIYQFTGSSLNFITSQNYGLDWNIHSVAWSPDGQYLALGGRSSNYELGYTEFEIFHYDGSSLTITSSFHYGQEIYTIAWNQDGKSLALGGYIPTSGHTSVEVYQVNYTYDTSPQGFTNGIVFGNSALGATYDLDINILASARVETFGNLMYDNVN